MWKTASWERAFRVPRRVIGFEQGDAVFSPSSNTLALATATHEIQLFSVKSGESHTSLNAPSQVAINKLAYTPNGQILLATTKSGGLHLWHLERLENELRTMGLNQDQIVSQSATENFSLHEATIWGNQRFSLTMTLVIAGAGLAVALALFTLSRHRRLLRTYLEIDALATLRNEELAAAQLEAAQNQKMKALGRLAAGVAHDFNNLLSVIRMSNQLTLERAPKDPILQKNLSLIEKSVTQGKGVVRSILGYSRASDDAEDTPLSETVEGTVAMLGPRFLRGIQLDLNLAEDLPAVATSTSRIQQILLNLILNAVDAMDGEGQLHIQVRSVPTAGPFPLALRPRPAEGYIELRVKDNGPGIALDQQERIFEPFYTTKAQSATPGTGLGLSTLYTISEQDGLGIRLLSAPGGGSEFIILIPSLPSFKHS